MNKTYINKLALLHIENKKLLVVYARGRDQWFFVGGKPDEGETKMEALKREVKEEVDSDIKEETLKVYGEFEAPAHGKPEGTFVRTYVYTGALVSEPKPSAEIDRIGYIGKEGLDNATVLGKIILEKLIEDGLID